MSSINKTRKTHDHRVDRSAPRLAGGMGPYPAVQGAEALLRRAVMSCLLWEDLAYQSGESVAENIKALVPQVNPQIVMQIAIEAREKQKLRHVPLLLAREMCRYEGHKVWVGQLLPRIIKRADELGEFVAIYFGGGDHRVTSQKLSKQARLGLAKAFDNFDAYDFGKYKGDGKAVSLRDVLFLAHPKPAQGRVELYKQIAENNLPIPQTWENRLSAGEDKVTVWTAMIKDRELGALAFLRNLRNMEDVGVARHTIQYGFDTINPRWLLPLNYLAAAKAAPKWEREIETLMLRGLGMAEKLPGYTIFVVDISGSMNTAISNKSDFSRLDAACAMAMIAAETCEHVSIYATAGSDSSRGHSTAFVPARHGFALAESISGMRRELGSGGIFTRQALEWIQASEKEKPDRIIVFSDSQDCDQPNRRVPNPFGVRNYIVDVSAHDRGIAYEGLWDAEISGWSEHFLNFIAAFEGLNLQEVETEN